MSCEFYFSIYIAFSLPLEDKKLLNIVLVKSQRRASECWKSLLVDQYMVDPFTFMEMEKKLTLERFQSEVIALMRSKCYLNSRIELYHTCTICIVSYFSYIESRIRLQWGRYHWQLSERWTNAANSRLKHYHLHGT